MRVGKEFVKSGGVKIQKPQSCTLIGQFPASCTNEMTEERTIQSKKKRSKDNPGALHPTSFNMNPLAYVLKKLLPSENRLLRGKGG